MTRAYPCPRCRAPLTRRSAGAASLLACEACGGAWLNHAVAGVVLAHGAGNVAGQLSDELARAACLTADTGPAGLPCPACGAPLDRHTIQGVVVDTCVLHGTWFDRDELAQTVAAYRTAAALGDPAAAAGAGSLAAAGLAVADVATDAIGDVAAESVAGAIFDVLGKLF
jgi:Zn-finger nucleic acid-binding protein